MKIQYKLLLIFILFLGFSLLDDSKVFAAPSDDIVQSCIQYGFDNMDSYYNAFIVYVIRNANYASIVRFNKEIATPIRNFNYFNLCFSESGSYTDWGYLGRYPQEEHSVDIGSSACYHVNFGGLTNLNSGEGIRYSTLDIYRTEYVNMSKPCSGNHSIVGLEYGTDYVYGDDSDKLNLYELNMTDLDYNSQLHKFNIATYTNSPCYDELMEYYNKDYQYIIYLTDYERILTYQNYDDDNSFLYGSYVISGYIDYLITDKAFFYYSEYYNQVLSHSGNTVFNKNKEDYTKRFYFKLTYSEDSNDPHAEIWSDNGNLYKIDYLESFEDRYFVGSSQTIYYANENSKGNYKDLTKDIYYLGYLNPTEGKTRDISTIPFYVYNFDYAGGSTELYVVNQNDYNYEEMINSRYDNWKEHYDKWTILTDGSTGGSYAQGNDLTSSTFLKGDVTDDTTTENDQSHIGEIRTPFGDTDVIDRQKETEEGIKDGTLITDTVNKIKDKFSFSNNIVNNANEIKAFITNTQETHKYYLNINHKYLNGQVCIIDLSWYEAYKPTVDAFICAFAYLAFIWRMFCIIPNLISGASASSYINDIQAYKETGFGRSSNIRKGGF